MNKTCKILIILIIINIILLCYLSYKKRKIEKEILNLDDVVTYVEEVI